MVQIHRDEQMRGAARAPVLAYTSHALGDDLLGACGVDGVLEKPCSANALHECLLRWCSPVSSRRASVEAAATSGAHSQR